MGSEAAADAVASDAAPVPVATVLGHRVHAFPSTGAMLAAVDDRKTILVALNAEKLARGDPRVKAIANAGLGYPDGYGAVLAMRRKGVRSARIAGVDLWLQLARRHASDRRFYVIGSTDEVVETAVQQLRADIVGIDIAGYRNGYLRPGDEEILKSTLQGLRPDIVFVAVGSPRQELLMSELSAAWPALYVGLGGSLDVYTGRKKRAPRWVQASGLEWAYRFVVDPRRLVRLPAYLRFAWLLALGRT